MRTQGAEWRFPEDGSVESRGTPWAGLSPAQIARLMPAAPATTLCAWSLDRETPIENVDALYAATCPARS